MQKPYSSIITVLGMLVVLGTAYGLDDWIESLRQASLRRFAGTLSWLIPAYLAVLSLASLMVAWLWLIHHQSRPGKLLALIYTFVGLGFLFYNVLAIVVAPRLPLPMQLAIIPQSLTAVTSALIAVIGLQRLILRQASL